MSGRAVPVVGSAAALLDQFGVVDGGVLGGRARLVQEVQHVEQAVCGAHALSRPNWTANDEVWRTIGAYLRATGRDDAVRQYIWQDFLGSGFDRYRTDVEAVERGAGLPATVRVVEFDSGESLRTAYHLIRIFNGHPYHEGCAEQFRRLGLAGKYLDDMADYTADVTSGSPNLLDAVAGLWPDELAAARSAVAGGKVVTAQWWRERCPQTYERYLREIAEHYDHVRAPALRLPLNIYSALLRTRRFWTVSTVRASQRAG
ncbi:hypothetical protein [Streptomyces mirabilis]|uniref:hypothetical protein n=1 Tax=Streptomyces mirabilis TaxID=68239 RepID=UPI00368BFD62